MTTIKTLINNIGSYGYGDYSDYLPQGKRPGKWLPETKPVLCKSGYHYCRSESDLVYHLGDRFYEVEVRGEIVEGDDKAAAEQIRLVRRLWADTWTAESQRLFAVDCSRLALSHADPHDRDLLSACLDVTTAYALYGAEFRAAYVAARVAAYFAAYVAARDAAYVAAYAAACAAADDAARAQQTTLLMRYLGGEQGPLVDENGEVTL